MEHDQPTFSAILGHGCWHVELVDTVVDAGKDDLDSPV